jgi:hypothetical protein
MPYFTIPEALEAILVDIQKTTKEPETLERVNDALRILRGQTTVGMTPSFGWPIDGPMPAEPPEWWGSRDPSDPDNYWICEHTGERLNIHTGERTKIAGEK